ncbi:Hpt domain-containing protein [Neptunicoccus cionae]|uniref:Hpt domain-containing protein n=1 Tax=Neptunicoccus cionae TaxID=2035344 RepID=UPI000C779E15|nr:Hpt domain-containing protein [Amylibacter cionae]PLS22871.1 histidine kinase [Amylibacter cionae]
MIDWAQVRQLREDIGLEELSGVVAVFLAEAEEAIEELKSQPPDAGDQMAATLHFLKGSASSMGFVAFAETCAQGESKAEKGQVFDVSVGDVVRLYQSSKAIFLKGFPARFAEGK